MYNNFTPLYQLGGSLFNNLNSYWDSYYSDPFSQHQQNKFNGLLDYNKNISGLQFDSSKAFDGSWGDDAHNFYYKQDYLTNSSNSESDFDAYANVYAQGPRNTKVALADNNLDANKYAEWKTGRDAFSNQAGTMFDNDRNVARNVDINRDAAANQLLTTGAGIFKGLQSQQAYDASQMYNDNFTSHNGFKGSQYFQRGGQPTAQDSLNLYNTTLQTLQDLKNEGFLIDERYSGSGNMNPKESIARAESILKNELKKSPDQNDDFGRKLFNRFGKKEEYTDKKGNLIGYSDWFNGAGDDRGRSKIYAHPNIDYQHFYDFKNPDTNMSIAGPLYHPLAIKPNKTKEEQAEWDRIENMDVQDFDESFNGSYLNKKPSVKQQPDIREDINIDPLPQLQAFAQSTSKSDTPKLEIEDDEYQKKETIYDFKGVPGIKTVYKKRKSDGQLVPVAYQNKVGSRIPYSQTLTKGFQHPDHNFQRGGIPTDPMGLYNHRGPVNIPSNQITMKGIDKLVLAIPDGDKPQVMYPEKEYLFRNSHNVLELPLLQYGGAIRRSVDGFPVLPSMSNNIEVQTEIGENILLPDGSVVQVKAKKKHSKMDKDEVTDILPENSYIYSNDKSLKISSKDTIHGATIGDIVLGKTAFEYKEGDYTGGPKDILFKDTVFNGKDSLTPAEMTTKIVNKYKISGEKKNYLFERADEENKKQRLEHLQIVKLLNEYKRPEGANEVPKANYGLDTSILPKHYNQQTNNGLDGVMGYTQNALDPLKQLDNNMKSMYNLPKSMAPNLFQNGGGTSSLGSSLGTALRFTPLGLLADQTGRFFAGRSQDKRNAEEKAKFDAANAEYLRGKQQVGQLANLTALGSAAYGIGNIPISDYQKYDTEKSRLADYNSRIMSNIDASQYAATNNAGGTGNTFARNVGAAGLGPQASGAAIGTYLSDIFSRMGSVNDKYTSQKNALLAGEADTFNRYDTAQNAGQIASTNKYRTDAYNATMSGINAVGNTGVGVADMLATTKYGIKQSEMELDRDHYGATAAAKDNFTNRYTIPFTSAVGNIAGVAMDGGLSSFGSSQGNGLQGFSNQPVNLGYPGVNGLPQQGLQNNNYYYSPLQQLPPYNIPSLGIQPYRVR